MCTFVRVRACVLCSIACLSMDLLIQAICAYTLHLQSQSFLYVGVVLSQESNSCALCSTSKLVEEGRLSPEELRMPFV